MNLDQVVQAGADTGRRQWLRLTAVLIGPVCASAAAGTAVPLCGAAPAPAYPAHDQPAIVQSWVLDGRHDGPAPDCGLLRGREFELLVRLTASFAAPDNLDALLARCGAISSLKSASYWSFSDHKRLALFREAFAVDQVGSTKARADFSAAELRVGTELPFVHSDNRTSHLSPYGMRLLHAHADGFVLRVENMADMRMWGMLLVAARETQWAVQIDRLGPGRWGYRSLLAQRQLRMGRTEQHRLSNLSRSVAMFDLLAGRQTEIEGYR